MISALEMLNPSSWDYATICDIAEQSGYGTSDWFEVGFVGIEGKNIVFNLAYFEDNGEIAEGKVYISIDTNYNLVLDF